MGAPALLNPALQFLDDSGKPLAGGSVSVFQAGTSTPQTTYTDSGLSVPNANPIILSSGGRCVMYLASTPEIKIIVKDSLGNTIFSQDNCAIAALTS